MDIREILQALDEADRKLWSDCRTAMRKVYLTAHNKVLGLADYEAQDDAFMDLIDIKLAALFDRGGRLNTAKTLAGDDADKIEKDLNDHDNIIKKKLSVVKSVGAVADTSKLPMNEWT